MKWGLAAVVLLAFILMPFLFLGAAVENFTLGLLADGRGAAQALIVISALALDVFLPIPSSIIGAIAGAFMGIAAGAIAIWTGLTLGCGLAYWAGQRLAAPVLDRIVGAQAREAAGRRVEKQAAIWLGLLRAVPVLAEASVLSAGALQLPFARFISITAIANAPIALVYAAAGAWAIEAGVFWPAFGAVAVTVTLYLLAVAYLSRREQKGA